MCPSEVFRNVVGLSPERVAFLQEHVGKLQGLGSDLPGRVLRYVLDGDDDACLADLARRPDAAEALSIWPPEDMERMRQVAAQYGQPIQLSTDLIIGRSPWTTLFDPIEAIDCHFYLRLGKMFEAAVAKLTVAWACRQYSTLIPPWMELLVFMGARDRTRLWGSGTWTTITGPLIVEMLRADGQSAEAFITTPFQIVQGKQSPMAALGKWMQMALRRSLLSLPEMGKVFAAHREVIVGFLRDGTSQSRLIAVENLLQTHTPAEPFLVELVACATDPSKRLREAAGAVLESASQATRPLLEQSCRDPKRTTREHAIRLLGRLGGVEARPLLESLRDSEPSEVVREAIVEALNESASRPSQPAQAPLEPPPSEPIALDAPLTPALRGCVERVVRKYDDDAQKFDLDTVFQFLAQGGSAQNYLKNTLMAHMLWGEVKDDCNAFLEHPDCRLIHAVRFLAMVGEIDRVHGTYQGILWHAAAHLEIFRRSHSPRITLRQVAEAIRSLDLPDDMLVVATFHVYYSMFDWEPEAVWPFFVGKMDRLEQAFLPGASDWQGRWERRHEFEGALRVLTKFPQVPPTLVSKIWDLAIGSNKADRLRAQPIAAKLPDLHERLLQALASRNAQMRAVTAEWMGRLGDRRFVAPLHVAAKREKQDATLEEMFTALERLGESIESYLNREKLRADAEKGLKKGVPTALEWFPWEGLPKVHWQDTGEEVPDQVVTWWLVQNYKLKSPEAGPLLRRYCAMLQPDERAELGRFVLSTWLDQDLKPKHSDVEARALAKQQALQTWQGYQQGLQWCQQHGQPPHPALQVTLQQIEEAAFEQLKRQRGSAVSEKGLLALAGACCDDAAVAPVQRYLTEWYGYRVGQCRALVAMLASVDRPAAIQYLLSITNRFRTKSIREEAERQVQILAERKGWTLDELADRTLPTAGFDEDGKLELDYGSRQFVVRVTSRLEAVLSDTEGKTLKSLPQPRKDDDEAQAKAAKKVLSAAKSELKKFTGQQTTRLYEAMCTERTWTAEDWRTYVLGHPLARFLCQRLVWAEYGGDRVTQTFRPLDDRTLTDAEDGEVQLAPDAQIRIAHACRVSAETAAAWARHLADYDVAPLFTQFGREPYVLPEEKQTVTSLGDFEGHMVEAFKLRSAATKLGYTRGQTQDGGWFFDYVKVFPGLGLEACLGFSGNGLPEENRTVALMELAFQRRSPQKGALLPHAARLPLGQVPDVLLTECYNDVRSIAATGSGFDPNWKELVQ